MKLPRWSLALLVAGLGVVPAPARAASTGDLYAGVGAGATTPLGRLSDALNTGFMIGAQFDDWYSQHDAAGIDVALHRFAADAPGLPHLNLAQIGLHDRRFFGSGGTQPYVTVGITAHSLQGSAPSPTVRFGGEAGIGVATRLGASTQLRLEAMGQNFWVVGSPRPSVSVGAWLMFRGAPL